MLPSNFSPAAAATLGLLLATTSVHALPNNYGSSQRDDKSACEALWQTAPMKLANLTIGAVEYREAGSNYSDWTYTLGSAASAPVIDLPAFCRFAANITTSERSKVDFEVWLPLSSVWSGRFVMVGNGGDAGNIYANNMAVPLDKYKLAVASTNTGHFGNSGDGTFAANNTESAIDFGYRAVHLTTVYSKEIIDLFYGKKASYSYWLGCSSGGKQGLKEIQKFPSDYDAALVGSPAWAWPLLNGWTYYVNALVNTPNTTKYISPPQWPIIASEIVAQCDELDGVKDGVLNQPGLCQPDYSKFTCGTASSLFNSSTCLSSDQVQTVKLTSTNWKDSNGNLLFPAFNLGSEAAFSGTVNGIPYGPAPSYFDYQILNITEIIQPITAPPVLIDGKLIDEQQLIQLVDEGLELNPGDIAADDYDLSPFFGKGGKVILYVGDADYLIPTNSSQLYYDRVKAKIGNIDDDFLFYKLPGMGHCQGGAGVSGMGIASQSQISSGGATQSPPREFNAQHDAFLALMGWRENGTKPGTLIATKYVGNDIRNGTAFTRKICPQPAYARYTGGNPNDESSFECFTP